MEIMEETKKLRFSDTEKGSMERVERERERENVWGAQIKLCINAQKLSYLYHPSYCKKYEDFTLIGVAM